MDRPPVKKRTDQTDQIHALHIFTNGNKPFILFEFTEMKPRDKKITTLEEYMNTIPGWTIECQDHDTLLTLMSKFSKLNSLTHITQSQNNTLNKLIPLIEELQKRNDQLQEFAIQTLKQTNQEVQENIEYIWLYNDYQDNDVSTFFKLLYRALQELQELIPKPGITENEKGFVVQHKRIQVCKYTAPEQFKDDLMPILIDTVKRKFEGRIIELWPNPTNDKSQPRSIIGLFALSHQMRHGTLPFENEQLENAKYISDAYDLARASAFEKHVSNLEDLETARHAARAEYSTTAASLAKAKARGLGSAARGLGSAARGLGSAARGLGSASRGVVKGAYKLRPTPPSPTRKGGKSKHVKRVKRSRRVKSSTKRRK
jgi:hypothetical protein